MKQFQILLALLVAASLSIQAYVPAVDSESKLVLRTEVVDAHILKVQLVNLLKKKTKVIIENMDSGFYHFSDVVNKRNGFSKKIDLAKLPQGRYILKVEAPDRSFKQVIYVKEEGILLSKVTS